MDVDIPQVEEAMETDPPPPPQLIRKDSVIDRDGDEVMEADAENGEEEGMYEDIEITEAEGDGDYIDAEVEVEVEGDGDGDITPIEADQEEEVDYEEAQAEVDVDVEGEGAGEAEEEEKQEEGGETYITAPLDSEVAAVGVTVTETGEESSATGSASEEHVGNTTHPDATAVSDSTTAEGTEAAEQAESSAVIKHGDDHHHLDGEADHEEAGELEDEYDLLTPESLPPILILLPNARRALFNPFSVEGTADIPLWFADKVAEYCEGTLANLLAAIRVKMDEEGLGNQVDELVVVEKLMDLKMGDSDVNLEDVTFLELVQMYHDCELPEPMELHVEFQPHRFITRFNAIQKELDAREVVYIEDEDDGEEGADGEDTDAVEEVEGEQSDECVETEEAQIEGDEGTHVEPEAGDESCLTDGQGEDHEINQTESGQAAVPLPESGADKQAKDPQVPQPEAQESEQEAVAAAPAVAAIEQESSAEEPTAAKNSTEREPALKVIDKRLDIPSSGSGRDETPLVGTPGISGVEESSNPLETTVQPESAMDTESDGHNAKTEVVEQTATESGAGDIVVEAEKNGEDAVPTENLQSGTEPVEDDQAENVAEEAGHAEDDAAAAVEEQEEEYDEDHEEEEAEGDDQDPYGVDKFVNGVSGDEVDAADEEEKGEGGMVIGLTTDVFYDEEGEEYDPYAEEEPRGENEGEVEGEEVFDDGEIAPDETVDPETNVNGGDDAEAAVQTDEEDQPEFEVVGEINGHSEIPADAEVLEEGDGDGEGAEAEEVEEPYDESGTILDDVEPSAEAESGAEPDVVGETTVDAEIQAPDETSPVKRSRSVEGDEPDEEVIKGKKAKIDGIE